MLSSFKLLSPAFFNRDPRRVARSLLGKVLILPRLLNYLIAVYLILIGLAGLFPHLFDSLR